MLCMQLMIMEEIKHSSNSAASNIPSEEDYYSDDFEQEETRDVVEVIQEIDVPSPLPPLENNQGEDNSEEEEAILVFKSKTGARLTIQPKTIPVPKNTNDDHPSEVLYQQPSTRFNNNNNRPPKRPSLPTGMRQSIDRRQNRGEMDNRNTALHSSTSREDIHVEGQIDSMESCNIAHQMSSGSPRAYHPTPIAHAAKSTSSTSLRSRPRIRSQYNYRGTTTTVCTGAQMNANRINKVPGSTNISNRNYYREKRYDTVAYGNEHHEGSSGNFPPPPPHLRMIAGPGHMKQQRQQQQNVSVPSNIDQRIASAQRITINDLRNRISMQLKEIDELKKENKYLKSLQNRQAAALKKWEGRDAELPRLLEQHKEEIKTTQIHLKKTVQHCRELEEKLKMKDKKIMKMDNDLQSLNNLVSRQDLKERRDLQEQVEILSENIAGYEKRIRQYMQHIEIMENNHKHQIHAEKQKLIRANNHALELRQEITALKLALKDKDRLLNYIQMRATGRNLLKDLPPHTSQSLKSSNKPPESGDADPNYDPTFYTTLGTWK